jgi:hypothetical protein
MARDEDTIGYKIPPKQHRFKTGKSGNPRGRVKGSQSFSSVFARFLKMRIRVTVDGKLQTMTMRDALLLQLINRALAGSPRHVQLLLHEGMLSEKEKPLVIRMLESDKKL